MTTPIPEASASNGTTQPEGEITMTTVDSEKWARAKEDVLGRVSAAFDLLAPVAEVGDAWGVEFNGKLELQDASLDSAIGIHYRTDVFTDDRIDVEANDE